MFKTIRFGAAGVAMAAALGMGSVAHAQDADADATAEVLQALTLNLDSGSLDFGTMVVNGAGSVVLAANGTLDCSAAQITCSGTTDVPTFTATGTANQDVTINLPTTVNLDHPNYTTTPGAQHRIELNAFTSDAPVNSSGPTSFYEVQLDGTGAASFSVGGTIVIDGSEVAGTYDGTFNVSVEYS